MSEINTNHVLYQNIDDIIYFNSHFFLKTLTFLFIFTYSLQIIILVSSILFVFNGDTNTNTVTLIIKSFSCYKNLMYLNLINLASLIGIPPLSGFILKFLIINNMLLTGSYIEFLFLFLLILLSMGIYIQVVRLFKNTIILNETDIIFFKKNNTQKYKFYLFHILCIFFFLFFFIFFKDFIVIFSLFLL